MIGLRQTKFSPIAEERGIAVLVYLPFGRSRLWQRVGDRAVPEWAVEFGIESWGQFFIKYAAAHPAVTVVTPATSKPHHMLDNIGAAVGELPDECHAETHGRICRRFAVCLGCSATHQLECNVEPARRSEVDVGFRYLACEVRAGVVAGRGRTQTQLARTSAPNNVYASANTHCGAW